MRAWRFAASLLLVAAVLAVYHWAIAVNAVTAATGLSKKQVYARALELNQRR